MPVEIKPIRLPLPFRMGSVNCYLVTSRAGSILVDTGGSNARRSLEGELDRAGCGTGNLNLIVLTHGDFDHIGNAAYLRTKFGARIAMGTDDAGMLERGDMFWNRKKGSALLRKVAPVLFHFDSADRCAPDILLDEGTDLSAYGVEALVLSLPGHSRGSIGILLSGTWDLFCGDLFDNTKRPVLNSIMDDIATAHLSLDRLRGMEVHTIYPGHGGPFTMQELVGSV